MLRDGATKSQQYSNSIQNIQEWEVELLNITESVYLYLLVVIVDNIWSWFWDKLMLVQHYFLSFFKNAPCIDDYNNYTFQEASKTAKLKVIEYYTW